MRDLCFTKGIQETAGSLYNYFLIDIKDFVDDQIVSCYDVRLFKNDTFSLNDVKGECYAFFEKKLHFGRFMLENDFIKD